MADPVEKPVDEVKAYDRLGNKILIPQGQVAELEKMGGRVASKAEVTAQRLEDEYAKKSTLEKAAGYATPALPAPVQMALRGAGVASLPPELESYRAGASQAFSGGLEALATKEGVEAVAGKGAAHAFGESQIDLKEAHPDFYKGGEVAGFIAGAVAGGPKGGAASKLLPSAGISAAGGLAERGVARALGGVAARGVLGRAVATGGELAARGAVEGSLYGAASQISDDMLADKDLAADKIFAAAGYGALGGAVGGAALGAGGSLVASGARGAVGAARSGITRALSRGGEVAAEASGAIEGAGAKAGQAVDAGAAKVTQATEEAVAGAKGAVKKAATEAVDEVGKSARFAAEQTGTKAAQEGSAASSYLNKFASRDAQKGIAYDQAWKAIGAGNGLQSTSFAKSAERYLPNGVKDVGEVIMRKGIINADEGLVNAMRHGTPEAMLPRINAARDAVGSQIGDMTAASPATVHGLDIGTAINSVAKQYEQSAATRAVGKSLRKYALDLHDTLGLESRASVPIQDLIRERQALDKMVFDNAALDPSLTIQVKRELRGKIEGLIMDGLDEASGKLPGEQKAAYKALKHDYTALSIASDAAEDSAARMAKGATFGLTDTLRGGGSIVKTVASKVVRERGNAAAAVLLSRMADMGTITRAVKGVDEQIGKAAKGLLAPPIARPLPEVPAGSVHARAEKVMRAVADFQANPQAHIDAITERTQGLATTTPELAGIVSQRMTSAMAFLASKVPVAGDPDPFDPHAAPKLNDGQAHELAAYGWYIEKPARFFQELEHGKITPEGVEVAKLTMPGAFAQLQSQTAEALAGMLASGMRPPYEQQRRLGALLEFPATPDQRPDHMPFLQGNVAVPVAPGTVNGVAPAPKRPLKLASQQSSLDRLSENGPGRR